MLDCAYHFGLRWSAAKLFLRFKDKIQFVCVLNAVRFISLFDDSVLFQAWLNSPAPAGQGGQWGYV